MKGERKMKLKKLSVSAFVYAVAAMAFGVFYREFTRFNSFSERTSLGLVHTHLFMLGMFFFLILLLLEARFSLSARPGFGKAYCIYHIGVGVTAAGLVWRGVTEVLRIPVTAGMDGAISGVSGIGHILTGIGIILFFVILIRQISGQAGSRE